MKTIKYPSLCATTEPTTAADGTRGSVVRCTATRRALGFVWWSQTDGIVNWNFRQHDDDIRGGTRNTERNAVQALRDLSNGTPIALPLIDPVTYAPTRSFPIVVVPPPVVVGPAIRRVIWNDDAPAFDVTAAVAAGFKRDR